MRYVDIHTHPQFAGYEDDRADVLARSVDAGVGMIVVGTQRDTSRKAIEIARAVRDNHGGEAWATVGLHPIHTQKSFHDAVETGVGNSEFTSRGESYDISYYRKLAVDPLVVAIGECGLDYYRLDTETENKQREAFLLQVKLANEIGKPMMLHVRNGRGMGGGKAYDDVLEIIREYAKVHSNVHCYTGDWLTACQFLDLGCTLSFTGVITFTHDYDEVVRDIPLDRVLTETDSPYMTPPPHRGTRNESQYVGAVVECIAALKGITAGEVAEATVENARRVFGLRGD
jgi:TatD DNase family protein